MAGPHGLGCRAVGAWCGASIQQMFTRIGIIVRGPQDWIIAPTFPFAASFCFHTGNTQQLGLEGGLSPRRDIYHMIHPH